MIGALLIAGQPLAARTQDTAAPPSLEELIPDGAIEAPEAWADGADSAQREEPQEIDLETPLEDFPPPPMEWPDRSELPPVEPIEADGELSIATVEAEMADPFADTDIERLSSELELAFPSDRSLFPVRDDFLARFNALSAIEGLESDDDSLAVIAARARSDEELIGTLLRSFGYYDAQIIRSVGTPDGIDDGSAGDAIVRFAILPGPRYAIGTIDLGELSKAPDYPELRAAFEIESGDLISSYRIVEEQFDLDTALGETGYPFAEIDAPELLVDHARDEGDLTMAVRPQGKYVFGNVTSSLPNFLSGKHFEIIARFDTGDIYQRSLELDLRRAIIATGLVSSADVTAREVTPPQNNEPGVVDLDVDIQKAKLRTIAGSVGYGTEEGFRVGASWEHRNMFPPEGALKIRGILGTREQLAGIGYKRNNFRARDQVLSLDAYATNTKSESVEARTIALRGTFERLSNLLFQKPFSWGVGSEILYSDERNRVIGGIPRPRQTYLIASLFGRATVDATESLLDPRSGFRATGFIAPEVSRTQGQDTFYLRNQIDASYYQPVGATIVLAGRVRFASIQGAKTFQIAPSRRLYSGGSNSVRGYAYQAVGPRNDFGEPTGGRSLVEGSIEARIDTGFFDGALQVVPFFDAGTVSIATTPDFRFINYGAGLGIRYKTGFGPIRVDVGVPLNRNPLFDSKIAVYVSLGQAF